ncbi:hydrogenase maturation protease [Kutzneria sp. CA-103260]|uniref:hydrogenase maturation protease n=1 Tax=Kutzneria sp. CA-103260 TaxID=2802641 RepID=UPI001BA51B61|nr:hydrogenase maturation protease [Kutzneria sp. CA-103260]QUQ64058.1 peptidase M52, hydrogen uptake protein [Kutzneria sp. CA-103260]
MNVVIGVGSPYRRDDAVGLHVAVAVAQRGGHAVQSDGEPAGLLLAWEDADLAVIVDAVVCEPATPGRIHRTATAPPTHGGASSHGLGIPEAVALATALGRMPRRLVVYAVEAADLSLGVGLSNQVARAVPALVDQVLGELGARLK